VSKGILKLFEDSALWLAMINRYFTNHHKWISLQPFLKNNLPAAKLQQIHKLLRLTTLRPKKPVTVSLGKHLIKLQRYARAHDLSVMTLKSLIEAIPSMSKKLSTLQFGDLIVFSDYRGLGLHIIDLDPASGTLILEKSRGEYGYDVPPSFYDVPMNYFQRSYMSEVFEIGYARIEEYGSYDEVYWSWKECCNDNGITDTGNDDNDDNNDNDYRDDSSDDSNDNADGNDNEMLNIASESASQWWQLASNDKKKKKINKKEPGDGKATTATTRIQKPKKKTRQRKKNTTTTTRPTTRKTKSK